LPGGFSRSLPPEPQTFARRSSYVWLSANPRCASDRAWAYRRWAVVGIRWSARTKRRREGAVPEPLVLIKVAGLVIGKGTLTEDTRS
jgi:hypothetical protein